MMQRKPTTKRLFQPGLGGTHRIDKSVQAQASPVQCEQHKLPLPCEKCEEDLAKWANTQDVWTMRRELRKIHEVQKTSWADIAKSAGIRPDQKCVHGMYLAEYYCEVCRFSPIDSNYNPDLYRSEITKAMSHANRCLYGDEGRKDLKDLLQIIDFEVWKASKKYGDKMSAPLAYTIANNQAGKYLSERIAERTVEITGAEGSPVRVPRFISFDVPKVGEDGKLTDTSVAEEMVQAKWAQEDAEDGGDWTGDLVDNGAVEKLRELAATFHGSKRLVAEAMLRPGFNVRSVPGVPKSTVGRVRQVVLREFKSFLDKT